MLRGLRGTFAESSGRVFSRLSAPNKTRYVCGNTIAGMEAAGFFIVEK
jgi:hypothetical protein